MPAACSKISTQACCYSKLILIWLSVPVKTLSDIASKGLHWVWRAVRLGPSQLHGEIRVPTTQGIWWTVSFLFREAHIELLHYPLLCVVHRRQKTPDHSWRSTPLSWALDFQLNHCSFVNITSSVINQVACSGLLNSWSNLSWSFEQSCVSFILSTYSTVERDHVSSFDMEVTSQQR